MGRFHRKISQLCKLLTKFQLYGCSTDFLKKLNSFLKKIVTQNLESEVSLKIISGTLLL